MQPKLSLFFTPFYLDRYIGSPKMRSLTLTRAQLAVICTDADSKAGALAVDPESGVLYVTVESKTDMGVEIEVVALTPGPDGGYMREVSYILEKFGFPTDIFRS
jgi:hypothetical protein